MNENLLEYEKIKNLFLDKSISIKKTSETIKIESKKLRLFLEGENRLTDNENTKLLNYLKQYNTEEIEIINEDNVFISYSHNDEEYLDRLMVHLKPLNDNQIDIWTDRKILSGDKWQYEIEKALKKSKIAILLISADFLASTFIVKKELPPILKKAEEHGTLIIPVILKPCRFLREQSLSIFQSINSPDEPICKLGEYDKELIYDKIAERVETTLGSQN